MPEPRKLPRGWWRYVVPNLVTCLGIFFTVISVEAAVDGRPIEAAWWGLLVVLTDKADGFFAVRLRGASEFGVQLDSLTDVIAFGLVPGVVVYGFFSTRPELGWTEGVRPWVLRGICGLYTITAALRLARFNVAAQSGPKKYYSGVPTTVTAGILLALFLAVLKYSSPSLARGESGSTLYVWSWLPVHLDAGLPFFPLLLPFGSWGMLSGIRIHKLGRTKHRVTDVLLLSVVLVGYVLAIIRRMPEICGAGALGYVLFATFRQFTRKPDPAPPV